MKEVTIQGTPYERGIAYGQQWAESFADDGRLTNDECVKIKDAFDEVLDRYVPSLENPAVSVAYNGVDNWFLRLVGIRFEGIKHYLNSWFGLSL